MLSTGWLAVGLSLLAVLLSFGCFLYCLAARRWMEAKNSASQSLSRLSSLEAELCVQADAISKLATLSRRQASRAQMAERRKRDQEPVAQDLDTEAGRTAARLELEKELVQAGRLNPRAHLTGV